MAKAPSLSQLANKPAPAAAATDEDAPKKRGRPSKQPDGRKSLLIRVSPEGWRELRRLVSDLTFDSEEQVTVQSLVLDEINTLLKRHGRPPVA